MTTDLSEIKRLASGRWREILPRLGGIDESCLDGRHHPCVKCGGTDRFSIFKDFNETGGMLCRQCFDKKNGDGIAALCWLRNWTLTEAAEAVAAHLGVEFKAKGKGKKKSKPKRNPLYLSLDWACRDAVAQLSTKDGPARVVASWHYGPFVVFRFDTPTPDNERQRKSFRPAHPETIADGRRMWRFGYPSDLKARPLYRLRALREAADTRLLVVCGGEKATDAAVAMGLHATTNAGGEKAAALTDWKPAARFTEIAVAIDNDVAGEEYFVVVAGQVKAASGRECKRIALPDLPPKGDIVEWIEAGGTREAFLEIVAATEATTPDRYKAARKICETIEVDVLGELPGGEIKAFSYHHGKAVEIRRATWIKYEDALQMFGPPVLDHVLKPGEEPRPGKITLDELKSAIGLVGGLERAGTGHECGQGVWAGQPAEEGGPRPIVLVGAGRAAVWDGGKLEAVKRPRAAGLKIDLGAPPEENWFDHRQLAGYLEAAGDRAWIGETLTKVGDLFAQWEWQSATGTVCDLITALVACSFVQTMWSWRPFVSVIGSSHTGKSTLFELLESLFGNLALLSSKSTEAGIRQAIGHHGKVILCDEFERDRNRQAILELFRTSSKGAKTLRGTTGKQEARKFGLRHIPWVTAVAIQLARAPDRNRFIGLELDELPSDRQGKLILPSEPELADLGQRLLALAVRYVDEADRLACRLKARVFPGIHGRVVESFSTPCGFLGAVGGFSEDQAAGIISDLFEHLEQDPEQGTKDETDLLATILGSHVDLSRGEKIAVGQVLSNPTNAGWQALDRVGIAPVAGRPGQDATTEGYRTGIFFAHREIKRHLLGRTKWEDEAIDQLLRRLPGATKSRQRTCGQRPYGVLVPWKLIQVKYLAENENEF